MPRFGYGTRGTRQVQVVHLANGAFVEWEGAALHQRTVAMLRTRMRRGLEYLRQQVMNNISTPAPPRSKEGEYPRADTERLLRSIYIRYDDDGLGGEIATDQPHGWYLERGIPGGVVIVPRNAKVLSWVNDKGERVFAHSVIQGPIRGRSFLARTLRGRAWQGFQRIMMGAPFWEG